MLGFKLSWNEVRVGSHEKAQTAVEAEAINFDLYYETIKKKIDLSKFGKLKWLGCDYKEVTSLRSQKQLLSLVLYGYPSESTELVDLVGLEELVLRNGSIDSLSFIQAESKLKNVELSYLSKLTSISGLTKCKNLEYLEIQSCKRIGDLVETVQSLDTLKVLKLIGFELDSLDWVKELPLLEQLVLIKSNVLSGDISPAKDIDYVAIDNKRHYNYRFDDTIMNIVPR